MKTIFKYDISAEKNVAFPKGAEIISVGQQNGQIMAWAIVDPEEIETDFRFFEIVRTGHPLSPVEKEFLGTVFIAPFGLHVFEVK